SSILEIPKEVKKFLVSAFKDWAVLFVWRALETSCYGLTLKDHRDEDPRSDDGTNLEVWRMPRAWPVEAHGSCYIARLQPRRHHRLQPVVSVSPITSLGGN